MFNNRDRTKSSDLSTMGLRSLAFTAIFITGGTSKPVYGATRLLEPTKSTSKLPTHDTLPQYKLDKILSDKAVQKLSSNVFAWVDLANKKVHLFSRPSNKDAWNHQKSLKANPGFKRYNKALKLRVSITPPGNYLIQDQGKFRRSSAYNNAPMPFYSRLWDPAQKPSPNESGIFFHVGKLYDSGSHGCIRLDEAGAKYIQAQLKKGDHVFIRRT